MLAAFVLAALPSGAMAQLLNPNAGAGPYNVQSMNFDLWCQERHAKERCDQRIAEDMRAFEDQRAVIERYELEFLMQKERDAEAAQRANRSYEAPWSRYDNPFGRGP
jgi:hypothetical protein